MKYFLLILTWFTGFSPAFAQADFIYTNSQACEYQTVTFAATPDTGQSYLWDFDNDGVYEKTVLSYNIINHVFNAAMTQQVGLIINYNFSPSDTVIKQVVINSLPFADFYVEDVCKPDSTVFRDSSSIASGSIAQYKWDFNNDGIFDIISQVPDTFINYGAAGTYIASLTCVSDAGCAGFTAKAVKVFDKPVADFSVQNTTDGQSTGFTDQTIAGSGTIAYYIWDFGDGQTALTQNPSHTYSDSGKYTVTLVAVSANYCADTITRVIEIEEHKEEGIVIKSVLISPNGDNINDMLEFSETECALSVYNRWNNLVYSDSGYNNDWSPAELDDGAYFYIINCNGVEKTGTVNVLK